MGKLTDTIPDPITTARAARDLMLRACGPSPKMRDGTAAYDAITATIDHAEKLQVALSVTHEEGRTEIARLEAEVEKLKAENERLKDSEQYTAGDCDEKQTQIDRLTFQLEQAREIISPFADAARSFTVAIAPDGIDDGLTVGARIAVMPDYEAVLSTYHFSRASQWIKDRQATGGAS